MAVEQMEGLRLISDEDLAGVIRAFREERGWSQDTLAALSRLSIRTIQRIEKGEPSNGETRRALARALELEDMDIFNKPLFPDPQRVRAEMEKFKREHVSLAARIIVSGQELTRLCENLESGCFTSAVELQGEAAEAFAGLADYLRDYGESSDCMSETMKLVAFQDVQDYIDRLISAGFSVCYARRDTKVVGRDWPHKTPLPWAIGYVVVYPKGSEPKFFFVPRQIQLS